MMHRIDLPSGSGLFVACPNCQRPNQMGGSKQTRVVVAFNSVSQKIQGTCSACKKPLFWTPQIAKVSAL